MTHHKKLPDQRTRHHHYRKNCPPLGVTVGHRIVTADHDEQHRQREIGVVHRALFADASGSRVGLASGANICDHFLLPGDDREKHIRRHDGTEHRTDVQKRRARTKYLEETPVHRDHKHKQRCGQPFFIFVEHLAQRAVNNPSTHDGTDADTDGLHGRQRHHALVDQVGARTKPVDDRQQTHSGKPGRVRLVFGPVQII